MQLLLLRHGDALDANSGGSDTLRPLSPLGEEQARAQGIYLRTRMISPDVILASPLLRAQQTAVIVRNVVGVSDLRTTEHLTPSSDQRQIVRELNELGKECVLLVGHEPHLSTLISLLIAGNRDAQIEMKKASLASLYVDMPVKYSSGSLLWLISPFFCME